MNLVDPTSIWVESVYNFYCLQDFFDKLNECIWSQKILPVFKLLAHALNSQVGIVLC